MNKVICGKCGKLKDPRGLKTHLDFCKGTLDVKPIIPQTRAPKLEIPMLEVYQGLQQTLKKEVDATQRNQIQQTELSKVCTCKGYDGQSFNCPVHPAKIECPGCHCIGTERKIDYRDPINIYRCQMCGLAYERNLITGEYHH